MAMLNGIDRFHLVRDVIDRVEDLGVRFAGLRQEMTEEHRAAAGLKADPGAP